MTTACAITACDRPVADATVCTGCANRTATRLRDAADLWPELAVTIARLDRMGDPTPRAGRPAPASPIRPDGDPATDQVTGWPSGLPVNLFASEVGDAVRSTVNTWAKVIADEVGADLPDGMPERMRWLAGRMEWARHQPWAPEAIDELGEVPRLLARALDRPPPRRYLGPCGRCGMDLYVRPGATHAHCGCDKPHKVDDLRAYLDKQVRQHAYTAAEIEAAYRIRADRIRKWASRGRIAQHGTDRLGRPLYLLGDVLDLAQQRRKPSSLPSPKQEHTGPGV